MSSVHASRSSTKPRLHVAYYRYPLEGSQLVWKAKRLLKYDLALITSAEAQGRREE